MNRLHKPLSFGRESSMKQHLTKLQREIQGDPTTPSRPLGKLAPLILHFARM